MATESCTSSLLSEKPAEIQQYIHQSKFQNDDSDALPASFRGLVRTLPDVFARFFFAKIAKG